MSDTITIRSINALLEALAVREQRSALACLTVRACQMEGEGNVGGADTAEEMHEAIRRLAAIAALQELAEGNVAAFYAADMPTVRELLAEWEKEVKQTINDSNNSIEEAQTSDPDRELEQLRAEDETQLALVRQMQGLLGSGGT